MRWLRKEIQSAILIVEPVPKSVRSRVLCEKSASSVVFP